MSLMVQITFDDNSPIPADVDLQLLNNGSVVSTATTISGSVTFNIDPTTLTNAAINLAPQQSGSQSVTGEA